MAPRRGERSPSQARGRGVLASTVRFWQRSYAPDYVGVAILLTAYLLLVLVVEPFHRLFFINDLRISFPHATVERVPVFMNFVYALFIPLGVLILANLATGASAHKHHMTMLGLAVSLVLTSFLTDTIKNAVGRPRPDLLARCAPAAGTPRDALVGPEVCTQADHHVLHDGWRSFPSGHSSFSFAGLGYAALWAAGQLRIFARGRRDLARSLLCLAPLLGAALVAISRCEDYRHDVYDVCAGSLLGWAVAHWTYRRYWPALGRRLCYEPYPPPGEGGVDDGDGDDDDAAGDGEEMAGGPEWRRVRDEEEGLHNPSGSS